MVDSGSLNLMGHCFSGESCMEQLKILDFPLESVEENAYEEEEGEDWNAKLQSALGPIPFDFLSKCLNENVVNGASDLMLNDTETVTDEGGLELIQPFLIEESSNTNKSKSVQPLSPISVLGSSNSRIPKRARSRRSRPSINQKWTSIVLEKDFIIKKKRKTPEKKATSSGAIASLKRCSHCQVTHTPQWREGPMGPKTLCNACGVRYRSGRLFPEYRPMASPGFVPSLHSNSHKKVLEMRNKGNTKTDIVVPVSMFKKDPVFHRENSPPPEFIPMSDYLLDCVLGGEVFNC